MPNWKKVIVSGSAANLSTLTIDNTTTGDSLLLTTTENSSTAAPVITLKRNSTSPADSDYLGQIKFKGENDADQEIVYAKITGKIGDETDGTEDGIIEFANVKAGSNTIIARLKSDKLELINGTNLEVAGNISTSGVVIFNDNQGINFGNSNAKIYGSSADGIKFNGNGSEKMRLTQAGNLGIGATSLVQKLTVGGNIDIAGGDGSLLTFNNGDAKIVINNNGSGRDLSFQTYDGSSTAERMRLTKAGNVGIGITNPSEKLEVAGNISGSFVGDGSGLTGINASAVGYSNDITLSADYTTASNSYNSLYGPLTVGSGVDVTVTAGSFLKIEDF